MKNHYIPQFIIKAFNEKPFYYDLEKGEIVKKRAHKAFFKVDFYDDETEKKINEDIETSFSNLLRNKLNGETVFLTREEVDLIKRYMRLTSIRTMGETEFAIKLKGFLENAKRYSEIMEHINKETWTLLKEKKTIADLGIADRELYMLALKRYSSVSSDELLTDVDVPLELYVWGLTFDISYLTFWEAPESRQFVLTDCGMNSEYEGVRHLLGAGFDCSKTSYLYWLLQNGTDDEKGVASCYLAYSYSMFENFDFFPVSNTRMIVAVHPFFRAFFPNQLVNRERQTIFQSSPDIWPTCLQNQGLFEPPECNYVSFGKVEPGDVFTYRRKELTTYESDYLNYLMINYAKKAIAYDDPEKVKISLLTAFLGETMIKTETTKKHYDEIKDWPWNIGFGKSQIEPLIKQLFQNGLKSWDLFVAKMSFEAINAGRLRDFRENPYVADFFLKNPDYLDIDRAFGFLGSKEERKHALEEIAKPLTPEDA